MSATYPLFKSDFSPCFTKRMKICIRFGHLGFINTVGPVKGPLYTTSIELVYSNVTTFRIMFSKISKF